MGVRQVSLRICMVAAAVLCAAQTIPAPAALGALTAGWETSQHASADLSFYQAPSNFSSELEPGSILKVEYATDLTNYTVPSGISMSRIIYTTTDIHGSVLPASAYVLWPFDALPDNDTAGYPIVTWAHGTSGLFQPCAPSNYRSLQYHFMIPYLLATQGMVVVAADYAGLGVGYLPNGDRIRHPWAAAPAQANDMAFAVTAARAAFPEFLAERGPFVAMGHSQGGRAAWGFAERQAAKPIAGYRGTVAFAPAGDPIGQIEQAVEAPEAYWSPNTQALQPLTIDSITAVYPSYNRSALTELTSKLFNDVYEPSGGCLPTQNVLFGQLPPDQLARPGWTKDPEAEAWRNLTAVGRKTFAGPLLALIGTVDGIIPYNDSISSSILSTVQDTCDAMKADGWTTSLEFAGYLGIDHFPVIQASQSKWLAWVKDRVSGIAAPPSTGCVIGEVGGLRTQFTAKSGPLPNFHVEWANQTNMWQYAL